MKLIQAAALVKNKLLIADQHGLTEWRLEGGPEIGPFDQYHGYVSALAVSADGGRAATARLWDQDLQSDPAVRVWDLTGKNQPRQLPSAGILRGLVFLPDGSLAGGFCRRREGRHGPVVGSGPTV